VTNKPRRVLTLAIYGGSVALHLAFAAGAVLSPKEKKNTTVAISLSEARKPPPKPEAPPPPLPPPPAPAKAKVAPMAAPKPASAAPAPPPDAPPSAEPAGFADLGLTMGNGGGGLAIPTGPRATEAPAPRETTRTTRALSAPREATCEEPIVKAKLRGALVKPAYTEEARVAQIEGVVRVELTVDDLGNVIAVKVLKGLGYGLDDAALRAAKQLTFAPGTRCGKAALTKLTVGMRFSLGQ
jgi:protein TonB